MFFPSPVSPSFLSICPPPPPISGSAADVCLIGWPQTAWWSQLLTGRLTGWRQKSWLFSMWMMRISHLFTGCSGKNLFLHTVKNKNCKMRKNQKSEKLSALCFTRFSSTESYLTKINWLKRLNEIKVRIRRRQCAESGESETGWDKSNLCDSAEKSSCTQLSVAQSEPSWLISVSTPQNPLLACS